jgi:large subunit ribosomal protein L13
MCGPIFAWGLFRTMRPKTSHLKPSEIQRGWYLADAENLVLGRMARDIAIVLMGKHKPTVSEHTLCGDSVVVINCEKVAVTGKKVEQKTYVHYTGYPGGRVEEGYQTMLDQHPERVLVKAVQRMLPKNRLGRQMLKNLFVYPGSEHPHTAQKPEPFPKLS